MVCLACNRVQLEASCESRSSLQMNEELEFAMRAILDRNRRHSVMDLWGVLLKRLGL
jgi:hypothetical protein